MLSRGTAIITGSARGISGANKLYRGEAIARRLALEGYRVCINDISANKHAVDSVVMSLNRAYGDGAAIGIIADVTKRTEVQAMIQSSVEQLGPLNVMVANAGICQIKEVLKITEEDIKRMFDVNVLGLFHCCTLAAKQMISQGLLPAESSLGYKIIGAASIVSVRPFALACHYTASKYAVKGFMESFALEMAEHNICVNSYAPGYVQGVMYNQIGRELDDIKDGSGAQTSVKRIGTPDDIGKVVGGFLAGPDSQYITGQTIIIDF